MENAIDLVIPMVFPQDPVWQREYQRFHGSPAAAQHNVRFRSWGTEELLIRCCMKYMPWLRRIHILLASESQVQPWMKPHPLPLPEGEGRPTLVIHYHADFIPKEYLPCFASPCIEMFLHQLPELSEHFIYSNDDIFPLSPLSPEDFFREGKPCLTVSEKPFPSAPNIFQRKCLYQLNMIGEPFGRHFTKTYLKTTHSMAPIRLETCRKVMDLHGDKILRHLSPLRRTDHSYNHYIYCFHDYFAGQSVSHAPREQYVGRTVAIDRLAGIIKNPYAGIVCLNDNENIDDWEHRAEVVQQAIAQKLEV